MSTRKEVLAHLDELLVEFFDLGSRGGQPGYAQELDTALLTEQQHDCSDLEDLYPQVLEHFGLEFDLESEDEEEQDKHELAIWSKWTSRRKIVDWLMKYEGQLDISDSADGVSSAPKPNYWVVGGPNKKVFIERGWPLTFAIGIHSAALVTSKADAVTMLNTAKKSGNADVRRFAKTAKPYPVRIEIIGD